MKKKLLTMIFLAIFVLLSGGVYWLYKNQQYNKESAPNSVSLAAFLKEQNQINTIVNNTTTKDSAQKLPKDLNFNMTFYSQAPLGNWAAPWQESCEEASILLVANLYQQKNWSVSEFNQQILQLVEWEKKRFGVYEHTDVDQTALMINEYLGLKTIIHENPSFEDVQAILNKGHLIVMTFAGKKLNNPFYNNGGPNYHAMVIKGYKEDQKIITEDVGTKRGEDYVYKWSVLENALHDYAEPIENGSKRFIEIFPLKSQ